MNKITGTLIIIINIYILSFPLTSGFARGSATIMGNLQTVSSDGPFDVIRNPAAMAFNGTSAGMVFGLNPYTYDSSPNSISLALNHSIIGDFTISGTSSNYKMNSSNGFNQEFALSIKAANMITFGIAQVTGLRRRDTSSTLTANVTSPVTDTLSSIQNEETDIIISQTYTSLGIRLTDSISLGVNIQLGFRKTDTRIDETMTTSSENRNSVIENSTESLWGELNAGFLHRGSRHQTGVNIYSGKFSWTRFSFHNTLNDIVNSANNFDVYASLPYRSNYTEGTGIVAGHYWRFNSFLAAAVEGGISLPNKYKYNSLQNEKGNYYNSDNTVDRKISFLASAGIELNPIKNLTIGLGGSYQNSRGTSVTIVNEPTVLTQNDRTRFSVHAVNSTAGISMEPLPGVNITFAATALYLKQSSTSDSAKAEIDTSTITITTHSVMNSDTMTLSFSLSFVKTI